MPFAWADRGWRLWQYAADERESDAAYGTVSRAVRGLDYLRPQSLRRRCRRAQPLLERPQLRARAAFAHRARKSQSPLQRETGARQPWNSAMMRRKMQNEAPSSIAQPGGTPITCPSETIAPAARAATA